MDLDCSNAEDFVDALTDNKYRAHHQWLFRGVKNASFALVPASHRRDPPYPFRKLPATFADQISEEFHALYRFREAAYREGLTIPKWDDTREYLQQVKERLGRTSRQSALIRHWPSPYILDLLAIAQHYGTPTRLLDWTWDALTAAYFAVPIVEDDLSHPIAVWVLDTTQRVVTDFQGELVSLQDARPPQIIEIPYDVNKNARAQRGVLLNHLPASSLDPADLDQPLPAPTPFDEFLRSLKAGHALTKVTLPGSEAPALLRELHYCRVDGATLFPGYLGASRAERERMWWDK